MKRAILRSLAILGTTAAVCGGVIAVQAQSQISSNMSFFITSAGKGEGANYGGLAGADAYCTSLAKAAGSAKSQWHAYLSTTAVAAANGQPAQAPVDARDRIGKGPWYNAKGVLVANNVDDLHSKTLAKDLLLTEKAGVNKGMGDTPNQHDILTGSDSAGRYLATGGDTIAYTIKAYNRGPDTAHVVVITDSLPATATFVSATGIADPSHIEHVVGWPVLGRTVLHRVVAQQHAEGTAAGHAEFVAVDLVEQLALVELDGAFLVAAQFGPGHVQQPQHH